MFQFKYTLFQYSMKITLYTVIILNFCIHKSYTQTSINSAGGNIPGNTGSVSYSIGQAFYTTYRGSKGSVAQGVQQAYEISVVSDIHQSNNIKFYATTYPNPTTDDLLLHIVNYQSSNLNFQLYNEPGQLLQQGKISSEETLVSMDKLIASVYYLKLTQGTKIIKVFKIVKN